MPDTNESIAMVFSEKQALEKVKNLYGWPSYMGNGAQPPSNDLKFSIVIPTLNQGKYIEGTILSLLLQDYKNLEIIIADGGSTDNTHAIIEAYKNHITHVLYGPDSGQSNAINKGFALATGDIFAWLNSDDYYLPNALSTVAATFKQNPDVRLVVGAGDVVTADNQFLKHIPPLPINMSTILNWKHGEWLMQQSCFWSRALWDESAGVDESLHLLMDYDLWFRFASMQEKTKTIDHSLAAMRYYKEVKTVKQRLRSNEELAYVYAKNNAPGEVRSLVSQIMKDKISIEESISNVESSMPVRILKRLGLYHRVQA